MKKRILATWLLLAFCFAWLLPQAALADVLKDNLPEVGSGSYVVIDGDTGETLFGKKYDAKFDPATLTQMMTAVLIIEHGDLKEKVTAPSMPAAINSGNTVYIRKNEEFELGDLLEAIVVYNANDAAYAAAVHLGGSVEGFVEMMNKEAKKLDMNNTTFKSPYGSAKGQESTALDMARLAAKASSLEKYVELTMKPSMNWNGEMFAQEDLPNACGFQQLMEEGIGLKFSNEQSDADVSQHLAASLSKGGRTVVAVVTDASNDSQLYNDMQNVLNFGMNNTKTTKVLRKNEPVSTIKFDEKKSLKVATKKDYSVTVASQLTTDIKTNVILDGIQPPVKTGDKVGVVQVFNGDEELKTVPLYAMGDVKKSRNIWVGIAILLAILYILSIFARSFQQLRKRANRSGQAARKAISGVRKPVRKPQVLSKDEQPRDKKRKRRSTDSHDSRENRDNPSLGSSEGRRGLEQKVQENKTKRNTYTIHREYPGEDR